MSLERRIFDYHVVATMAHVHGLGEVGHLGADQATAILSVLVDAAADAALADEPGEPRSRLADYLRTRIGDDLVARCDAGHGAHDQAATETRLWTRDAILDTGSLLVELREALTDLAGRSGRALAPGVQPAILFGHYLLAYVEQFYRDGNRLKEVYVRADILPLGAGDGAGAEIALDRAYVARLLGMHANTRNSIDGVGDRDFTIEHLSALAMIAARAARVIGDLGRVTDDGASASLLEHVESLAHTIADDWRTAVLVLTRLSQGFDPVLSTIDLAMPCVVERAQEALRLALDAVRAAVPPADHILTASSPLDRFVSRGGTAPALVKAAIEDTSNRIDAYRQWIDERRAAHPTVDVLRHFPTMRDVTLLPPHDAPTSAPAQARLR